MYTTWHGYPKAWVLGWAMLVKTIFFKILSMSKHSYFLFMLSLLPNFFLESILKLIFHLHRLNFICNLAMWGKYLCSLFGLVFFGVDCFLEFSWIIVKLVLRD